MDKIKNNDDFLMLKNVIRAVPGHIYWKDLNGRFLGCNEQQAKSLGVPSSKDIIGKTDYDFLPKEVAKEIRSNDKKVIKTKSQITVKEPLMSANGEITYYLSKKSPLFDRSGKIIGIIGATFDLTSEEIEKNKLIIQKKHTEITLDKIISLLPGHVYWKNKEGIFLGCNMLQARSLGIKSPDGLIGKNAYDTLPKQQADKITAVDNQVMKADKPYVVEEIADTAEGKTAFYLSHKVPLKDDDDKTIGILGISFDITKQKTLEKKLREAQAREARFKAMSALGGMMAHELRTPLASIKLALESWRDYFPKIFEGYQKYAKANNDQTFTKPQLLAMENTLDSAERSVADATHTIDAVLADIHYAIGDTKIAKEPFNVYNTVQAAVQQFPFQLDRESLVKIIGAKDAQALGDERLVIHVLHNLLKNALHVIEEMGRGEITIRIESTKQHIQIIFEDTAKGIPKEILPHIFEPFYTTKKETAASIGVGLHFCQLALEKIDASITCESEEGKYTRFIISLLPVK